MEKKSKEKNKISVYFTHEPLNYQHLNKSFVNIPKVMSQERNVGVELNCYNFDNLEDETIVISSLGKRRYNKIVAFYHTIFDIFVKRKSTHAIMLLHLSIPTSFVIFFSKLVNKEAKIYLKLDINKEFFDIKLNKWKFVAFKTALKKVDCISYESMNICKDILASDLFKCAHNKLVYIPNCIPEANSYIVSDYDKRENIFITVGRLGSYQKNTHLFLDAISNAKITGWSFYFVGSISEEINIRIESLASRGFPVKYIGEIRSREEMISLYERSKVFVLTSRYEGFATVLAESSLFGNYIVSTNVNGAKDITNDFEYGTKITDLNSLTISISSICSGEIDIESLSKRNQAYTKNNFNWESVLLKSNIYNMLEI
ncbi:MULTISPECIES: glycosyltransferase family 4 protein [Vibrio]|uniref:glycosyltransferase family 4 protein n=1 Tax=Vibrio TaxID=662 RepID=UPI001301FFE9|nr:MULTISPECIES: glycosyltransferase [Vibrio]BCN18145.1 putative glycosyltransferase [Vibrio cholerae]